MKRIINYFRQQHYWYTYERQDDTWTFGFLHYLLHCWIWSLIQRIQWTICTYKGHKYEVTGGYANGDSGGDYYECRRCGHGGTHIYY